VADVRLNLLPQANPAKAHASNCHRLQRDSNGSFESGYALEMPRVPAVIPEPMLARLTDRLPTGPAWSHDLKWDAIAVSR
jgi:hypothetical protein